MIRIASEKDLINSFRPIDQDHVHLAADVQFPLVIKNYLSWIEPSGARAYLVYEDLVTNQPMGIAFRRTLGSPDAAPVMCQWCNTVRGGGGVSLMTAAASENRSIGVYLCSDLKCEDGIQGTPGIHALRESLTKTDRMQRLMSRITEFAKGSLF